MIRTYRRPRVLDLFCCAGGAGMGYWLAGFDVVGDLPNGRLQGPMGIL